METLSQFIGPMMSVLHKLYQESLGRKPCDYCGTPIRVGYNLCGLCLARRQNAHIIQRYENLVHLYLYTGRSPPSPFGKKACTSCTLTGHSYKVCTWWHDRPS